MSQPWAYCEHCGTIEPPERHLKATVKGMIDGGSELELQLQLQEPVQHEVWVCSDCGKEVEYDDI